MADQIHVTRHELKAHPPSLELIAQSPELSRGQSGSHRDMKAETRTLDWQGNEPERSLKIAQESLPHRFQRGVRFYIQKQDPLIEGVEAIDLY